jgi:hypothetical protein
MAEVAIAMAVVSAVGSIQAGKAQKSYYQVQSAQARVESERKAIQYQIQANQVLQKVNSANASAVARGFSGGVQGFDGSSALIQAINNTKGGKDFVTALENSDAVRRSGLIQATLYENAGETAEKAGYFDAAGKLGMSYLTYAKIGGPPSTTQAPVYDMSRPYTGQIG